MIGSGIITAVTRKTHDLNLAWYDKVTSPLSAFVRQQRELDTRRMALQEQMRMLDRQAHELCEQVSLVAGRQADLKDRIAILKKVRLDSRIQRSAADLLMGHEHALRFAKPPR